MTQLKDAKPDGRRLCRVLSRAAGELRAAKLRRGQWLQDMKSPVWAYSTDLWEYEKP